MNVELEAAYIGLESSNPAAIAAYLGGAIGLMPGEPAPGAQSTWRVDGKVHRVWVQRGERDDAACIGFEAAHEHAYELALSRLRQAGIALNPLTAAEISARAVEEGVVMATPWGVPLELVRGLADAPTPFASPQFPQGLVTRGQGFGHFVFLVGNAADYEASRRFAIDALGLKLSDWLRLPMGEIEMHVSFFHCNPRHHSLAIGFLPMLGVPQKLHHINFEVARIADVGAAWERALKSGTPIANTMGQHANDGMVSFYSVGPGGWRVEIGATGRTIGEDWNDVREYDRISDWGHQPPETLKQMLASGPPIHS